MHAVTPSTTSTSGRRHLGRSPIGRGELPSRARRPTIDRSGDVGTEAQRRGVRPLPRALRASCSRHRLAKPPHGTPKRNRRHAHEHRRSTRGIRSGTQGSPHHTLAEPTTSTGDTPEAHADAATAPVTRRPDTTEPTITSSEARPPSGPPRETRHGMARAPILGRVSLCQPMRTSTNAPMDRRTRCRSRPIVRTLPD